MGRNSVHACERRGLSGSGDGEKTEKSSEMGSDGGAFALKNSKKREGYAQHPRDDTDAEQHCLSAVCRDLFAR